MTDAPAFTVRSHQVYDHRLRDLAFHTGDVAIAHDCGVPRSIFSKHATLGVGPADSFWAELFPQGSVLGLEVLDNGLLVTVDPTRKREKHELEV